MNTTEADVSALDPEDSCPNFYIPFLHPCDGFFQRVIRSVMAIIVLCGLSLNITSLVAFSKIKMNAESLFLMKCLAVYDTLYLVGAFFAYSCVYLLWELGFGYQSLTAYLYVEKISEYTLQRVAAPMSYWIAAVLTVQR